MIKPVNNGFILINQEKAKKQGFENAHTHIKNKGMATTIRDNVLRKKMPKTRNTYLLSSHLRISTDEKYMRKIQELIDVIENKDSPKYYNVGYGKICFNK